MEHMPLPVDLYSASAAESTEAARARRLMAMGQMAASLAHEIRNPLGSMELFCSLLRKDLQGDPQKLHLAEQIQRGIKSLDRIISNCLQFARDVVPRRGEISNVKGFLEEIIQTAQGKYGQHCPTISLELLGDGSGNADGYQLGQALLNVLLNALDAVMDVERGAMRAPQVKIVSDLRDPTRWVLSVQDNGQGMSAEVVQRVFDPFYTTKPGGTGLGLAVVHTILSAHQGTVGIQSLVGTGTTVTFEIPREGAGVSDHPSIS